MSINLDLRRVASTEMAPRQRQEIVELCSTAFNLDYSQYLDLNLYSVHILGYVGSRLVAHALWLERRLRIGTGPWLRAAYVEGVATYAGYRRRGYGAAVMGRLQQEIAGFDLGALSPATEQWYARLGWERWLGPLLIDKDGVLQATPGECVMVYRTPGGAALDLTAPLAGEWRPFELW